MRPLLMVAMHEQVHEESDPHQHSIWIRSALFGPTDTTNSPRIRSGLAANQSAHCPAATRISCSWIFVSSRANTTFFAVHKLSDPVVQQSPRYGAGPRKKLTSHHKIARAQAPAHAHSIWLIESQKNGMARPEPLTDSAAVKAEGPGTGIT